MPFNVFNFIILVLSFHGFILNSDLNDINGSLEFAFKMWDPISDANNAPYGISSIGPSNDGSSNNPFPNFWTILFTTPLTINSMYGVQVGISVAAANNGKLAVRTKDNSTWANWNIVS